MKQWIRVGRVVGIAGVTLALALSSCGSNGLDDLFSGVVIQTVDVPTPLPDGAMPGAQYPSMLTVSTPNTSITSILVGVGLTHERAQDLDLLLVGPTGIKVMLMSDCLGNWNLTNDAVLFSDTATTPVPAGTVAPPSGALHPIDYDPPGDPDIFYAPAPGPPYSVDLADFLGTNPNGTWRLYIYDDTANGTALGELAGWQLFLDTQ